MKKAILILFLFSISYCQNFKSKPAEAVVLSTAVGTRIPTGTFGNEHALGYGFNMSLYYTQSEIIPVLLFTRLGIEHYSGSQNYLKNNSKYSSINTTLFPITLGIKYYYPPILTDRLLILPFFETGLIYAYTSKVYTHRQQFIRDVSQYNNNFGLNLSAGLSSVLFDFTAFYNYIPNNQHFGFDIRVNIPIYTRF